MQDLAIIEKEAAPVNEEALRVAEAIDAFDIMSNETLQTAMKGTAAVKKEYKKATALMESFTGPLKESLAAIKKHFKPGLKALEECEKVLKAKATMFIDLAMDRRDALLEEMAHSDDPTTLMKAADTLIIEEMPGLSIHEPYWTGEITEGDRFVRWAVGDRNYSFLQPNLKAIKKHVKHLSEDPGWPGWKAYTKRTIAITVDKIEE